MSAALESGDVTFTRTVLKPSRPSLDHKCGHCGRTLTASDYHAYIGDDLKLVLTAIHCERTVQWRIYLDLAGTV